MLQKREDYNDLMPTLSFTVRVLVLGGVASFLLSPGLHKSQWSSWGGTIQARGCKRGAATQSLELGMFCVCLWSARLLRLLFCLSIMFGIHCESSFFLNVLGLNTLLAFKGIPFSEASIG